MTEMKLTAEQQAEAAAYGMTDAEYIEMTLSRIMPEGTYKLAIQGAKCETSTKGKSKDARQVNLRTWPLSSEGTPVKRFGSLFARFTSPRAEGEYKPSLKGRGFSVDQFRNLAEQVDSSVVDLLTAVHSEPQLTDLIGKEILVTVKHSTGDNGQVFVNVNMARKNATLTDLSADGQG